MSDPKIVAAILALARLPEYQTMTPEQQDTEFQRIFGASVSLQTPASEKVKEIRALNSSTRFDAMPSGERESALDEIVRRPA